jgi:hypothetical protein
MVIRMLTEGVPTEKRSERAYFTTVVHVPTIRTTKMLIYDGGTCVRTAGMVLMFLGTVPIIDILRMFT